MKNNLYYIMSNIICEFSVWCPKKNGVQKFRSCPDTWVDNSHSIKKLEYIDIRNHMAYLQLIYIQEHPGPESKFAIQDHTAA